MIVLVPAGSGVLIGILIFLAVVAVLGMIAAAADQPAPIERTDAEDGAEQDGRDA